MAQAINVTRAALAMDLQAMSTSDLRAALAQAIGMTATTLARMAEIWMELESRGEDLSDLRGGLLSYIPVIATGKLLPDLVVRCAGQATLLKLASDLSPEDQRSLLDHGARLIEVGLDGEIAERRMPLESLSAAQARIVIAGDQLRTPAEQAAIIGRVTGPRTPTSRGVIVKVRLSEAEYQSLRDRARRAGRTVPTYTRAALLGASE